MKKPLLLLGSAGALVALGAPAAAQTRFGFSTGFEYSVGDYGQTTDTEVLVVPFSGRVMTRHWTFRASIPYLEVRGPADVVIVIDGAEGGDGGSTGGATTDPIGASPRMGAERGFGDMTLAATRAFNRIGGSPVYIDVTGRVRLPTGDEDKGLGVGTVDYGLASEVGYATRRGGAYASVGRRFLGSVAGRTREDGWQAGGGGWIRANPRVTLGLAYDWREATNPRNEDPSEATAFVSYRLPKGWRMELNASAGFSDGSPDSSVGMRASWRSRRRP